jgi:hypothetical protein
MLGYRGMVELAYRSGHIEPGSFQASAIYEHDEFDYGFGTDSFIKHKPKLLGERGQLLGFYAVCRPKGARPVFDVMRKDEVDAIRGRSKAGDRGPWVTDYNAMGCKTVLRRFWKMLPSAVTEKYADLVERDTDNEFGDIIETVKRGKRAKIASVTGEEKERIPEWSEEENARVGELRQQVNNLGEAAEAEGVALWKRMRYDMPEDVIEAFRALIAKHESAQTTAPEAAPEPERPKTLDDAKALVQRCIREAGDDEAGQMIEPILDEFAVHKLGDIKPELLGEFCERLEAKLDDFTGRA